MSPEMIAFCGLDCGQCPAYLATATDDDALRAKTAREWSATFNTCITPEQIVCSGCKSEGPRFSHCAVCAIRACASGRSYATCAECPDFACEHVAFVIDHVPQAKAELEARRARS